MSIFMGLAFTYFICAGGLQHLVGSGHDARVHFIGTLRGDQVGNFGHGVDVGVFEIGLR